MQLRTPAVDRLIDALSPALSDEIDRILSESREILTAEFETRLQATVREAEAAARRVAETERETAVAEASEKVRRQVSEQSQAQFSKTLEETVRDLKANQEREFQKAQGVWNAERNGLEQRGEQWRVFAEAQAQLIDAGSQPEILRRWLTFAESFASSIAVYVTKADGLALWKSRGKAVFPEIISQQTTDPESYFKPVNVRGKIVAAVCAVQPFRPEALDFLVAAMERAIELFGLKLRTVAVKPGVPEVARVP